MIRAGACYGAISRGPAKNYMGYHGRVLSTIAVGLIAALSVVQSVGQGTVNFNNANAFATEADRVVRDTSGLALVGTNYFAQLYYGVKRDFTCS
jgi:hypothetical protein